MDNGSGLCFRSCNVLFSYDGSQTLYDSDNSVIRVFSSQVTSAEKQDFITYSVYFSLVTVMSILSTFSDKGALTQIGMADQIQENIREDEYVDIHNKVLPLENKILNVRKVL